VSRVRQVEHVPPHPDEREPAHRSHGRDDYRSTSPSRREQDQHWPNEHGRELYADSDPERYTGEQLLHRELSEKQVGRYSGERRGNQVVLRGDCLEHD